MARKETRRLNEEENEEYNYFRQSRLYFASAASECKFESPPVREKERNEGGIVNFGETPRSRSKQANPFVCSFVRRESEGHESADALSSSPPPRSSAADKFRLRIRG